MSITGGRGGTWIKKPETAAGENCNRLGSCLHGKVMFRASAPAFFGSILFLGLTTSWSGAAIDFTPTTSERTLEGIVFKQLVFHEDGRPITYEHPRGWTYSGDASRIRFTAPGFPQAQAEINQVPAPKDPNFDESAVKALREEVLASVPKGSQNVVVIGDERSPITINGRPTYGVTVAYNLFGQDFGLSVLFANLPNTQLRFRVIARKQDFPKVHTLFRGSLVSLQWK
jgi:hypothetical protein